MSYRAAVTIQRKYRDYKGWKGVDDESVPPPPTSPTFDVTGQPASTIDSMKMDYDMYMKNRRPGSTGMSEVSVSSRQLGQQVSSVICIWRTGVLARQVWVASVSSRQLGQQVSSVWYVDLYEEPPSWLNRHEWHPCPLDSWANRLVVCDMYMKNRCPCSTGMSEVSVSSRQLGQQVSNVWYV